MVDHSSADQIPPELVQAIRQTQAERERLRQAHPELFAAVSAAMFHRDPVEINYHFNTDEYDAEAGTVIPRLKDCASAGEVANVLHEEFVRWFGAETAGPRERYLPLSEDIWAMWTGRAS
ncbi:MAG: hypothetical protein KIT86_05250 [Hydrogenophaga sp.]|jgi:hypothetical protein|uniref:hypothetical protein n=1 Tax=Hydrogenophaga sp. TaxID=1904254 RepID=UPI00260D5E04|nr:hypothetical protein [Hydrogenophaga sp.]MCW5669046.1 hypothetical protein [Hydrogenophaga sp.]